MSAYLNFSILTYFREANLLNNERYTNTVTITIDTISLAYVAVITATSS